MADTEIDCSDEKYGHELGYRNITETQTAEPTVQSQTRNVLGTRMESENVWLYGNPRYYTEAPTCMQ